MKKFTRTLALVLALMMVLSVVPMLAMAAEVAEATVDTTKKGSLTIYKYDLTNAEKDGVWDSSYVSTGVYDPLVNQALGEAIRNGDTDNSAALGNQQESKGYAIKGVTFTYMKIAEVVQFTEAVLDGGRSDNHVEVLYGISKRNGEDFLTAIGLSEEDRYKNADYSDKEGWDHNLWYFRSDTLVNALKTSLANNSTKVKNALESYVKNNGGIEMPETTADGRTYVNNLDLGLYLLCETKCPEYVVDSCDPFLVSVPMTSVNGNNANDGGTRWIYDITLYPKNLTGIPSLTKELRENVNDTGSAKHTGSVTDIDDGFGHYTTASAGDVIDFQILSTLPSITSTVTYLSEYSFVDTLEKGVTFNKNDVVLQFFTDKKCTAPVPNGRWTEADGYFKVSYTTTDKGEEVMTITMTDAGLALINSAKTVYTGANMVNSGYSDCTLRITYQGTVDSNSDIVCGDTSNKNSVVLTWRRSDDSYYDTLVDDVHIYTYGLDLTKQFSDNKGNFENVEFVLHNDTDNYYVVAALDRATGIYYVTDHVPAEADATHFRPVISGEVPGKVIIKGLEDDTYTLTEVRTDNGYVALKEDVTIVITSKESAVSCDVYSTDVLGLVQNDSRYFDLIVTQLPSAGAIADILHNMPQQQLDHKLLTATSTVDGNAVAMTVDSESVNALAALTVINTRGTDLPQTGELGTFFMTLGGFLLVMFAMVALYLLIAPKRKKEM